MADKTIRFGLFADDKASATFDRVGSAAERAGGKMRDGSGQAKEYGKGLESAGEKADKAEQRTLGMKDTVDGVATIMQGPGKAGIGAYIQGWADLAGGLANFVIPSLGALRLSNIRAAASTVTSTISQKAAAVASKSWAAAQWLVNAALSANPIGIVIVAVAALAAAVFIAYKRSETFRAIVNAAFTTVRNVGVAMWRDLGRAFSGITGAISGTYNWVRGHWPLLLAILTGPIGLAALAISRNWDKIRSTAVAAFNGLVGFARGVPGRISGAFAGSGKLLVGIGSNIVGGLWSGFRSAMGDVGKILGDVKDRIVGGLKKLFGINSPSTVMAELGGHMITGLIRGLLVNSGALARTVKDIGGNVLGNVGQAGLLGGGGALLKRIFGGGGGSNGNSALGQRMAAAYGWTGGQWNALSSLWQGESGWNNNAQNPTSTAYGIAQFLNSTWASVGASKTSDPAGQIAAGLQYIRQAYGDPANAYSKWLGRSPHWYGSGMAPTVFSSPTLIGVGEAGAETVSVTPHGRSVVGGVQEVVQPIQLVVDGKVLHQVLLKIKRANGGLSLGLA